jgi:hypothetical protein
MFDSVEDIYQEQTAQTFQIALQAGEPLSLITFWFLDELGEADPDFAIHANVEPIAFEELQIREEDMERRLDGRCKGLLEVTKCSGGFPEHKVDFLHRTVRDFLLMKHMQVILSERTHRDFNPRLSLCNTFLAQMKATSTRNVKELPLG